MKKQKGGVVVGLVMLVLLVGCSQPDPSRPIPVVATQPAGPLPTAVIPGLTLSTSTPFPQPAKERKVGSARMIDGEIIINHPKIVTFRAGDDLLVELYYTGQLLPSWKYRAGRAVQGPPPAGWCADGQSCEYRDAHGNAFTVLVNSLEGEMRVGGDVVLLESFDPPPDLSVEEWWAQGGIHDVGQAQKRVGHECFAAPAASFDASHRLYLNGREGGDCRVNVFFVNGETCQVTIRYRGDPPQTKTFLEDGCNAKPGDVIGGRVTVIMHDKEVVLFKGGESSWRESYAEFPFGFEMADE